MNPLLLDLPASTLEMLECARVSSGLELGKEVAQLR